MVIDVKPLLRVGVAAQTVALLGENVKAARSRKPKLVKTAVGNIVGIELLRVQSGLIGGI